MTIPLWARLMEASFIDCPVTPHPKDCEVCWLSDWLDFWWNLGVAVRGNRKN